MRVIGLTGGIGSGKSAVCRILDERGIPILSADELARQVVAKGTPGLAAVVQVFGEEVLTEDGSLNRKRLGDYIFADTQNRQRLESITHPLIRQAFHEGMKSYEEKSFKVMVYEIPLLFEAGLENSFEGSVVVWAPKETRVARVKARSGLTDEQVRARMQTQFDPTKAKEKADYVLNNAGSNDDLRAAVEEMIRVFLHPAVSET